MSLDDEDLRERYDLLCELEAAMAGLELEDLTREELIGLIDIFDRMAPDRADQDRSNVLDYPGRPSSSGSSDGWSMFKFRLRCERERVGQLIGAEPARLLPPNVTAIGERRGDVTPETCHASRLPSEPCD
ncbi:hypothetical protein [Mycolicibacterium llatzerense]|uniref:hypothetical protein n=1 Tax=Mycolicibacterium llatzerense TaxID=280871 RepID=UPI0008DDDDF5|nr:hypothetical protein [Mycolicibacterium llatzerense]